MPAAVKHEEAEGSSFEKDRDAGSPADTPENVEIASKQIYKYNNIALEFFYCA